MKESFTMRIEDSLREHLEEMAEEQGRSLSNLIHLILHDYAMVELSNKVVKRVKGMK